MRSATIAITVALLLPLHAACKKGEEKPAGSGAATGATPASKPDDVKKEAPAAAAAALIPAGTKAPAGVTFKKVDQPFGSIELPDGADWKVADNQVEGKDGTVIMMQAQDNIPPDAMDDYLASYNEVQVRDAPKYERKAETKGSVGGSPAARVEGAFDNGTKFVTRDYLIFSKGKVVAISARSPEKNAAALAALVDYAAASLQVK